MEKIEKMDVSPLDDTVGSPVDDEFQYDKELVLEEFHRFYGFINDIILPYERTRQHAEFAEFHLQLMYTVCQIESATASPRGVLKSQIAAKYRNLHRAVDPNPKIYDEELPYILIISEGSDLAKEHIEWMKDQIRNNPYLVKRYGDLYRPQLTWNEEEIELSNGSIIKAKGITSALRGKHPTDITVDDAESENNISTEKTLASLKARFWKVIWPMRRGHRTSLHVIGTIVAASSLLSDLIKSGEFFGKKWKALYVDHDISNRPDGLCSIWPKYWSVEWLLRQRARMGLHMFNAEFQNEPVGRDQQIIYPEWIKEFTAADIANMVPVRRYMAVDPAFTEEKWGCFSAIVVFDEMPNGWLVERLNWRGKVPGPVLRDQIIATYRHMAELGPKVVLGIEEVAAQKILRQLIQEKEPSIQVIPVPATKDKTTRLVDVSRYIELGIVRFESKRLINELLEAPQGVMDSVDATVHALKLYEKDHPVLADGTSVELDTLKSLDDTSLNCYLDRALGNGDGLSTEKIPAEYRKRYQEALLIQQFLEEMDV